MKTLLIASGGYCEPALAAEFGRLPSALLPLGGGRLYELQLRDCQQAYQRLLMSLPSTFELDPCDERKLVDSGVELLRVDEKKTLGWSIHESLTYAEVTGGVDLLWGDTLIDGIQSNELDTISTGIPEYSYDWGRSLNGTVTDEVLSGFFSFSDVDFLKVCIEESNGDFVGAVELYNLKLHLKTKLSSDWLDLGHIHTYFHSRAKCTTERAFNKIVVENGVVTKKSDHIRKLKGESAWFKAVPDVLKVFSPQHLGEIYDNDQEFMGYKLEYLPLPNLADLLVFGKLKNYVWGEVFTQCDAFFDLARNNGSLSKNLDIDSESIFLEKTLARIDEFLSANGYSEEMCWVVNGKAAPNLKKVAVDCFAMLQESSQYVPAFIHGDFCFSNILYDSRLKRIKLIDPRGVDYMGQASQHGDQRYDIAKLAHSVLGSYDFIVAGRYDLKIGGVNGKALNLQIYDETAVGVQNIFKEFSFNGRTADKWGVGPAVVLLFLGMLPLHSDSEVRQMALLGNACSLYQDLH